MIKHSDNRPTRRIKVTVAMGEARIIEIKQKASETKALLSHKLD